jgi:hypothetical protein
MPRLRLRSSSVASSVGMLALLIRMPAIMQAAAVIIRIVNMDIAWFVGLESVTRAQPVPSEG